MNVNAEYDLFGTHIYANKYSFEDYVKVREINRINPSDWHSLSINNKQLLLTINHEQQHHVDLISSCVGVFLWQLDIVIRNDFAYIRNVDEKVFLLIKRSNKLTTEERTTLLRRSRNKPELKYTFNNLCDLLELRNILRCNFPLLYYEQLTYLELTNLINRCFKYLAHRIGVEHKYSFKTKIRNEKVFSHDCPVNYCSILESNAFLHEISFLRQVKDFAIENQTEELFKKSSFKYMYKIFCSFSDGNKIRTAGAVQMIEFALNTNWIVGLDLGRKQAYKFVNANNQLININEMLLVENLMPATTVRRFISLIDSEKFTNYHSTSLQKMSFYLILRSMHPYYTEKSKFAGDEIIETSKPESIFQIFILSSINKLAYFSHVAVNDQVRNIELYFECINKLIDSRKNDISQVQYLNHIQPYKEARAKTTERIKVDGCMIELNDGVVIIDTEHTDAIDGANKNLPSLYYFFLRHPLAFHYSTITNSITYTILRKLLNDRSMDIKSYILCRYNELSGKFKANPIYDPVLVDFFTNISIFMLFQTFNYVEDSFEYLERIKEVRLD